MGLLSRLFNTPANPTAEDSVLLDLRAEVIRDELVNVVGESNYQPAIREACGWEPGTDTHFECFAELVPEPTNRYDPNAVRVDLNGACVGYLSRADALELGPAISEALSDHCSGLVRAVIAGRADGDTDNLGVFLHLNLNRKVAPVDAGFGMACRISEEAMDWSRFDDHRRIRVVGNQYHQPALLTASEHLIQQEGDRCETEAMLVREPNNAHDHLAVQVMVNGKRVGYLQRGSAKRYNKRVKALEDEGKQPTYPLLIRMQSPGMLQPHLQVAYSSELLKGFKNTKRS
jgi:hypothetical protein